MKMDEPFDQQFLKAEYFEIQKGVNAILPVC